MGEGKRTRRKFTDEFKRDAVELVRTSGKPIATVAAELGIYDSTLGNWVNQDRIDRGEGYEERVLFDVGVPNVEAALKKAESLGGKRRMGPEGTPGNLVVGQFTDPQGNLIGVAGTE